MKKSQDNSVRASALQIAPGLALILLSLVLVASGFAQRSDFNVRARGDSAQAYQTGNVSTDTPDASLPVVVTATAGNTGPTSYPTLQLAFAAIDTGVHQGAINVAIVGDTTETASAVLNASGGRANYTSISAQPSGGAARTVSGAMVEGRPLIDLNGATNVTIDGLNIGGNSLTITNTTASATAGTSTIRFINGAQNNIVTRCAVLGSSISAIGIAGGNVLFSTTTGVGNNNNTISFCNLGPAGTNLPTKALMSLGTAANPNTSNLIDSNNIFDFFNTTVSVSGISVQDNSDNWSISNNRIFQTEARAFTGGINPRYAGITIDASGGAFTVSSNLIGFGAADGTGMTTITGTGTGRQNEFRGIDLPSVSITTPTSVQGNIISGINQTSARSSLNTVSSCFTAIDLGATDGRFNVGDTVGNAIGSLDGSSTIVVTATSSTPNTAPIIGILDFSTSSSNTISNNDIGNITINPGPTGATVGFRGIYSITDVAQLATLNDNTIASITDNVVGSYAMYGIYSSLNALNAAGNVVRNMSGNANGPGVTMTGILVSAPLATQPTTVSLNTVHTLSNRVTGSSVGAVYGMHFLLPWQRNVIRQNLVHSLDVISTLTEYQIWGLVMEGQGTATFQNNMVRLGLNATGSSITTGFSIVGIRDKAGATAKYCFNSVYIGGTGVTSASNTFAFLSDVVDNTRKFRDNIFYNARSNASGGIANAAIQVNGLGSSPAGLTSNYNDLYATGTDGVIGVFNSIIQPTLSDWQIATGQDANGISADPQYLDPDGNAATVDLHIDDTSPCAGAGVAIAGITDDFDGDPRLNLPSIGADERGIPSATPAPTPTPTVTPRHTPTPRSRTTPAPRPNTTPLTSPSAGPITKPLASPAGIRRR